MTTRIDNIKLPDIARKINLQEAEIALDNYVSELIENRKSPIGADLAEFFTLVQNAIRTREDQDGFPEGKKLLLVEEDPPEKIDTEAITWFIKARTPGRFDQGPAGLGKVREVVPHTRAVVSHPEHPNEKLITMGKFYSNWIQFNIYAREAKQAMKRLFWFENVMDGFSWYFRLYGFRAIEEGVGDREKIIIDDLKIVKYPITYFVRSEDTYHMTTQELKKVLFTTNVSTS